MPLFSQGFQLNPVAKGSPKALVLLLSDPGTAIEAVAAVAARWAASVPAAAFIALEGSGQSEPMSDSVGSSVGSTDPRIGAEPDWFDRAGRGLAPLIALELRTRRLDGGQLVLVGFGAGGTLALHLVLRQGWSSAGVLAFALTGALLLMPVPVRS